MFKTNRKNNDRVVRKYKKGEIIFHEGDTTQDMFIIKRGNVSIEKKTDNPETIQLALLSNGNFFGEMAMIEGLPRSATARAETDVEVQTIHSGNFLVFIQKDPTFAFEIINSLSNRIRVMNNNLIEVIKKTDIDKQVANEILSTVTGNLE